MEMSRRVAPDIKTYSLLLLIVSLIGGFSWLTGGPVSAWKTAALNYDDAEYVYQAIETTDHLNQTGLISWPQIIYRNQHYGKPPLFVNTLAATIELTGRERALAGVRLNIIITNFALLAIACLMFHRLYGTTGGLLATLSIIALPAFASWASRVVPDIQVALFTVAAIAVFASNHKGPLSTKSCLTMGVIWGLGMYSKATYPLYAAGPALIWLMHNRSLSSFFSLIPPLLLALLICSIWYIPNFKESLHYVLGAVDFIDDPDLTRATRFGQWAKTLTIDGLGWCLLLLATLAIVAKIKSRKSIADGAPTQNSLLSSMLFFSALPMIVLALTSSAPPNTRHPLPSLVLISLLITATLLNHFRSSKYEHIFKYTGIGMLSVQAAALLLAIIGSTSTIHHQNLASRINRFIAPGFMPPAPIDDQLPIKAYATVKAKLGNTPSVVYLAGHDGSLHVPKLNLIAILDGSSIRFDYATYFSWSKEYCQSRLAKIIADGETVLFLENKNSDDNGASKYFNRYQSFGKATLEDQLKLNYSSMTLADSTERRLSIFHQKQRLDISSLAFKQVGANFADVLLIAAISRTNEYLVVRIKSENWIRRDYKLMLHIEDKDSGTIASTAILDQYIKPPFSTWRPGSQQDIIVKIPEELHQKNIRVELGFFDEGDSAHGWPRLRAADGRDFVELDLHRP